MQFVDNLWQDAEEAFGLFVCDKQVNVARIRLPAPIRTSKELTEKVL